MDVKRGKVPRRRAGKPVGSLPVRQFIVKVHGRCDLRCDYCYVFAMGDQRWRHQPRKMAEATVAKTAQRIAEYADLHFVEQIHVVLHGGEPLLAGPEFIETAVGAIRSALGDRCRAEFSLQTNAVRLDDSFLALFDRLGIGVGVSLDGNGAMNDAHRRFADGRGSHSAAHAGLQQLCSSEYRHLFDGLLCTIDVGHDPVEVYESLVEYAPPAIDFLLPHGSWAVMPPGVQAMENRRDTPYATWLTQVFDHWYGSPGPATRIRLFEEIINLLLGGVTRTEELGGAAAGSIVFATNGTIELSDALLAVQTHAEPDPGGEADVWNCTIDAFLRRPDVTAHRAASVALCETCRNCAVKRACGGGLYIHRYKQENGFDNPSVYCADLFALITYIRARILRDVTLLQGAQT